MTFVLDSFAIIKLVKKEKGFEKIQNIILEAKENKAKLLITTINFGEVLYRLTQLLGGDSFSEIERRMLALSIKITEVTYEDVVNSARLKSKEGISYADCFTINLAKKTKATILTGDKEFKKFTKEVNIEWV